MFTPYKPLHTRPTVPDMPTSPPEISDEEYARNVRNSCRDEAIIALGTVISRLIELDWDEGPTAYLNHLREELNNDMEDAP